jgi:hypothetical protein
MAGSARDRDTLGSSMRGAFLTRRDILNTGVALLVTVTGCVDTERTEVKPGMIFPLEEGQPTIAYLPGTSIDISVWWTARCTTDGVLPDTSSTKNCDEQDFTATVTCSGGPCDLDPPTASSGIALTGEGMINVKLPAVGDVAIDVVLEHSGTHEQLAQRGQIAIRDMERLVIDCRIQPFDAANPRCVQRMNYVECFDVPWVACPASTTVDPTWGTPVSMWIYGEGGGLALATTTREPTAIHPLEPEVAFSGLTLPETQYVDNAHANAGAAQVALKFKADLKTAGTLQTTAHQNGMVAETVMQLAAP